MVQLVDPDRVQCSLEADRYIPEQGGPLGGELGYAGLIEYALEMAETGDVQDIYQCVDGQVLTGRSHGLVVTDDEGLQFGWCRIVPVVRGRSKNGEYVPRGGNLIVL